MESFTPEYLNKRTKIFESHKDFGKFLNSSIINKLVNLFDEGDIGQDKITKYIEDERRAEGLNTEGIDIVSSIYGLSKGKANLFLIIKKNNNDLLHLTIHLTINNLYPRNTGMIHISKNIYIKEGDNRNICKALQALILVETPKEKNKSLIFSIADGYYTTGLKNSNIHDSELQKEMNVIITVLNRLFDEDNKEFYIGNNSTKLTLIHNKTNRVLNIINKHPKQFTRKNKGVSIIPLSNNSKLPIKLLKRRDNKKSNRQTRRVKR